MNIDMNKVNERIKLLKGAIEINYTHRKKVYSEQRESIDREIDCAEAQLDVLEHLNLFEGK